MKLHLPSQGLMSAELGPKQHSTHPCLPLMGICCIRFSYLPVLFQENSTGLSPRLALQLQFHCRGLGQALICLAHQDLLFKRGHQLLLQTKILLTCSSPPRKSKTAGQEKGRDAKKSPSVSLVRTVCHISAIPSASLSSFQELTRQALGQPLHSSKRDKGKS